MDQHDAAPIRRWVEDRLEILTPEPAWQPDVTAGRRRFSEAQAAGSGPRRAWSLTLAAMLIAGLCVSAFPTTRVFAARCVAACVGQASRASQLLKDRVFDQDPVATVSELRSSSIAPVSPGLTHPGIGDALQVPWAGGVAQLLGRTGAHPAPAGNALVRGSSGPTQVRGFNVVGVSLDERRLGRSQTLSDAQEHRLPRRPRRRCARGRVWNVTALPRTLLIDRSGRIAARFRSGSSRRASTSG
jgi:hypothetical protein